jgi:glycosyltransferase involved in cell wall biosynthesis
MNKHLLFIIDSLCIGGTEKKFIAIANRLTTNGYRVHIIYLKPPNALIDKISKDVMVVSLNRKHKIDLNAILRYRKYIQKYKVDIVISASLYPMLVHRLAMLGVGAKPTLFVAINSMYTYMIYPKLRLQMYIYERLLRRGCITLFGAAKQMDMWVLKYKLPKDSVRVIYNGIDHDYYSSHALDIDRSVLKKRYGIGNEEVVLGMVASLRSVKSNIDLIRASKVLLDNGYKVKVVFAGDGTKRQECIIESEKMKIRDKIIFLGNVADVRPVLLVMDIFVLTSQSETFSNAALEAMAMSKPVILSDVGGASEMVIEGLNGFLYPPGDLSGLVSSIITIIDNNCFDDMGKQSRRIIENNFTFDEMIKQYERVMFSSRGNYDT